MANYVGFLYIPSGTADTPPGSFKEDFNSALGCNITPTNQSNCIKDNKQNKKILRINTVIYHSLEPKDSNVEWSGVILPLTTFSIITLMIIENRALWLARSFASSRYNHRAVIITLKASSFQNGSQICWCFGVGNWSIILFSRIIINVIILKQLVASGDVNIGE